jgi:hypothetical protein
MSEAVKCRQGMLGMDLCELSSCAIGLTLIVSSSALEESISQGTYQ